MRVSAVASLKHPQIRVRDVQSESVNRHYKKGFDRLVRMIYETSGGDIDGIGLSIAGIVDVERGTIRRSPSLKDWERRPIAGDLATVFDCRVVMRNDAVCSAIGESRFGKGGSFVYLTWGTGIGGTQIFTEGSKLFVSPFEPGQQSIDGSKRTWESVCGGKAIRNRFGKTADRLSYSEWNAMLTDFEKGLFNVLTMRPCDTLVLGGGIFCRHPEFVKRIATSLRKQAGRMGTEAPPSVVRRVAQGESAGLYGAVALLDLQKSRISYL